MAAVFLSYRRDDTGGEVGRLSDSLREHLGSTVVFRDVDSIPLGAEFDDELERALTSTRVVVVLIGPKWLAEIKQRQSNTGVDYLRLEVATALSKGKRVIPVLLKGAGLPATGELPEDLATLTKHQAMTLRDEAWSSDVVRLVDAIGRPYRWRLLAVRGAIALPAIMIAVWALVPQLWPDRTSDYDFMRVVVATLIAMYALSELFAGYRHRKATR